MTGLCNFGRGRNEEQFCKICEFGPVVKEKMSFKDNFHFKLWWPFFQQSEIACAILVEGIMRNIYVKL